MREAIGVEATAWRYASVCNHADWFLKGAQLEVEGAKETMQPAVRLLQQHGDFRDPAQVQQLLADPAQAQEAIQLLASTVIDMGAALLNTSDLLPCVARSVADLLQSTISQGVEWQLRRRDQFLIPTAKADTVSKQSLRDLRAGPLACSNLFGRSQLEKAEASKPKVTSTRVVTTGVKRPADMTVQVPGEPKGKKRKAGKPYQQYQKGKGKQPKFSSWAEEETEQKFRKKRGGKGNQPNKPHRGGRGGHRGGRGGSSGAYQYN